MIVDHRWTQTCITDLRSRLQQGESVTEIAMKAQRTAASVTAMMARLRLREAGVQ